MMDKQSDHIQNSIIHIIFFTLTIVDLTIPPNNYCDCNCCGYCDCREWKVESNGNFVSTGGTRAWIDDLHRWSEHPRCGIADPAKQTDDNSSGNRHTIYLGLCVIAVLTIII
jgi:hypothetical protein